MTLLPYITSANYKNLKRPMFLFLTFPLADQIETYVTILKLSSLKFRYCTCLLLSNGKLYIPKTTKIWIKNSEKIKLWTPHVPFIVHLNVHSPKKVVEWGASLWTRWLKGPTSPTCCTCHYQEFYVCYMFTS
jgi:hypothetical protein